MKLLPTSIIIEDQFVLKSLSKGTLIKRTGAFEQFEVQRYPEPIPDSCIDGWVSGISYPVCCLYSKSICVTCCWVSVYALVGAVKAFGSCFLKITVTATITSLSSIDMISCPAIFMAVFFTIAFPMFCTMVRLTSVDVNVILKDKKAVPGTITSFAPSDGKRTVSCWF